jgi:hypothetical protein
MTTERAKAVLAAVAIAACSAALLVFTLVALLRGPP